MAVGQSSNGSTGSKKPCHCYKVAGLTSPILESPLTSNLLERYDLGGQLGWGQFGVIRECTDLFTGEKLACKSIAKDRLVTEDDLRSVKLEIEIMSRLSGHPNVVELKAVYEEERYVHIVMELCAGGELFHLLEKCGRFSEPQARILFLQLMEVVMFCHDQGIVHRDLKPENVLLATDSPSSPIKLADFGLATFIEPGNQYFLCSCFPIPCPRSSCSMIWFHLNREELVRDRGKPVLHSTRGAGRGLQPGRRYLELGGHLVYSPQRDAALLGQDQVGNFRRCQGCQAVVPLQSLGSHIPICKGLDHRNAAQGSCSEAHGGAGSG